MQDSATMKKRAEGKVQTRGKFPGVDFDKRVNSRDLDGKFEANPTHLGPKSVASDKAGSDDGVLDKDLGLQTDRLMPWKGRRWTGCIYK